MRDRLDQDTRYDELPDLINRSVEMMMDEARDLLTELGPHTVPAWKIRAAFAELERQIRPAEEKRLREAWLALHGGERIQ